MAQAATPVAAEPGLRDYWLQRSTHLLPANKLPLEMMGNKRASLTEIPLNRLTHLKLG